MPVLSEVQEEAAAVGRDGPGLGVIVGFDLMAVNLSRLARLPRLLAPLAAAAAALQWTGPEPDDD